MITNKSILSKVLKQITDPSSLKQLKSEIFKLLLDERNLSGVEKSELEVYVLFSLENNQIVCKSREDLKSQSNFFFDGSRKNDNFIYLSIFGLMQINGVDNNEIEKVIDNWFKETFIQSSTEELLKLQNSITSTDVNNSGLNDFIFSSVVIPPLALLEDYQLEQIFKDTILYDVFRFKEENGRLLFSSESIDRLFKIKDKVIQDALDDLKGNQNDWSFQHFILCLLKLRMRDYLTVKNFYSLMKTVFEIDDNIWHDMDYFLNANAQYLARFKPASELLIDFEISSKEEADAIIELFHSVLKVFFLKGNRLYSSSDFYFSKMIEAIYKTKWIPEDFDFGIGIPKSRLSLFSLRQKFSD